MSLFTDHPHSVGETYAEHAAMASGFGWRLIVAGLACFVHAVFPFLCKSTGSRAVVQLHAKLIHGREKFGVGDIRRGTQNDWCI